MRWLDDVSMDLREMGVNEWRERESKEPRGLEAYCRGGQGPPRAVAPSGGGILEVFLHEDEEETIFRNVKQRLLKDTAEYPRRLENLATPL